MLAMLSYHDSLSKTTFIQSNHLLHISAVCNHKMADVVATNMQYGVSLSSGHRFSTLAISLLCSQWLRPLGTDLVVGERTIKEVLFQNILTLMKLLLSSNRLLKTL